MRTWGIVVLVLVLLPGCVLYEDWRTTRAEADIQELWRECLVRKQADPRVDCSDFRPAADVRIRGRVRQ